MTAEAVIRIVREALLLILVLSGGPLLASMITGLLVSLLQATTQLQEQTLTYVPKLVAVLLSLMILGPWILYQAVRFTTVLFDGIATVH
jgi:flagellar biosynthetic protein FliQ